MARKNKSKAVNVRVSDDLHRKLEDIADRKELSISELVRPMLERAVRRYDGKDLNGDIGQDDE